jgi:hypothetical protein
LLVLGGGGGLELALGAGALEVEVERDLDVGRALKDFEEVVVTNALTEAGDGGVSEDELRFSPDDEAEGGEPATAAGGDLYGLTLQALALTTSTLFALSHSKTAPQRSTPIAIPFHPHFLPHASTQPSRD